MNKKIRVLELFAGIGAFRKALINLNLDYEIIDVVENNKQSIKSYNALYSDNHIPKNVIDYELNDKKVDILIHGSPCQDFSIIGKGLGGAMGSNTRSSLLFETIRIIKTATYKPKIVIWENVKNVLSFKNRNVFLQYKNELKKIGYVSKYKVLNARDFGIPQNRNRVFVVSILNENNFDFNNLEKKEMKNIKNFISDDFQNKHIIKCKSLLSLLHKKKDGLYSKKIFFIDKYCNTITTYPLKMPNCGFIKLNDTNYRILTEKETTLLMGFDEKDYEILKKLYYKNDDYLMSNIYKQMGNSIVVTILESIIKEILRVTNLGVKNNP